MAIHLPGSAQAAERLRETALQNFAPPGKTSEGHKWLKRPVSADEIALPDLARYALELVGPGSSGTAPLALT